MSEHTPAVIDDARPHYQDINAPVVVLLTVVTAILTYAMIALVQGYYFQWKNAALERVNAAAVSNSTEFMVGEKSLLRAGSTDRNIGKIEDSMAKVVKEWGAKPTE